MNSQPDNHAADLDLQHLAALSRAFGDRLRIVVLPPSTPAAARAELLGDLDVTDHARGDIATAQPASSAEIVDDVRRTVAPLRWW